MYMHIRIHIYTYTYTYTYIYIYISGLWKKIQNKACLQKRPDIFRVLKKKDKHSQL